MIALSYSRLSDYLQCPHVFFRKYVEKSFPKDDDNPHFVKGKKKHGQLENYINCKNDKTMIQHKYDGDVKNALTIVDKLIDSGFKLKAEVQLAVDINFKACDWFSKQAAWRAIIDVYGVNNSVAINGDWKTGKFRDYDGKETGQLHLSSALMMCVEEDIEVVNSAYFYIEHKQSVQRQFKRDMNLLEPFVKLFEKINTDKEFCAKRNEYCNWCLIKGDCPLG